MAPSLVFFPSLPFPPSHTHAEPQTILRTIYRLWKSHNQHTYRTGEAGDLIHYYKEFIPEA